MRFCNATHVKNINYRWIGRGSTWTQTFINSNILKEYTQNYTQQAHSLYRYVGQTSYQWQWTSVPILAHTFCLRSHQNAISKSKNPKFCTILDLLAFRPEPAPSTLKQLPPPLHQLLSLLQVVTLHSINDQTESSWHTILLYCLLEAVVSAL